MIDIQNLTFRYAGQSVPVFRDFSLQLRENRIYGLLGKNGTGKSTLLYLIAGLLRPQVGSVSCNTVAAFRRPPGLLRDIFIVTEEFDLPAMTLEAYVRLIAPFYPRFSQEVLQRCLDDFELPASLRLNALSMGQKKKVYMSIALAARTRLLLMDEPTNGLDIPSKSQFRRVIAQNMTDDRTFIISTHQVHDVEALLDHLLILSNEGLLLNAAVDTITDRYTFTLQPAGSSPAAGSPSPAFGSSPAPGSPSPAAVSPSPAAVSVCCDVIATPPTILYAEPTLQGNLVLSRRDEGAPETQLNLELLFNAVTKGLLR